MIEVVDHMVQGAAQLLFRECSRAVVALGYSLVNTIDAFGLPGLAASKQSYRPIALLLGFIATPDPPKNILSGSEEAWGFLKEYAKLPG